MAFFYESRPRSSSRTRTAAEKPALAGHGYASHLRAHHGRSASMPDAYCARAASERHARATPDVYARPAGDAYARATPDVYARATPDGYVRLAYDARGSRSSSRQRAVPGGSRDSSRAREAPREGAAYAAPYTHVEHVRMARKEEASSRARKASLTGQTFAWMPSVSGPEPLKRQMSAANGPHPLRESSRPATPQHSRSASDPQHRAPHSASRTRWPLEPEPEPKPHTTEEWVREQQAVAAEENEWRHQHREKLFGNPLHAFTNEHAYPRPPDAMDDTPWDELARTYELDAERWMRAQEAARADARARERERVLKEQMHRVEARIRGRREAERAQASEERARRYAQERLGRARARSAVRAEAAWRAYEEGWARVGGGGGGEAMGFASVPWPTERPPARAADVTPERVAAFLLSDAHSAEVPRKERIRRAQLRWHPDRFQRLMVRVVNADKREVEEAAGIVARCLNDLMAMENAKGPHAHRRATH
ncbi:hypothetical protein HDZ31DRAFT_59997 [Schizophyllum fasciatum]